MRLYSWPALGGVDLLGFRIGGPGLGNLLFPWARWALATRLYGMVGIRPTWPQVKLGPLLRRERDVRWYGSLFREDDQYIGGARKARLLLSLPRVEEAGLYAGNVLSRTRRSSSAVVVFRGLDCLFEGFLKEHDTVKRLLRASARPEVLSAAEAPAVSAIGVHVRMGDFRAASTAGPVPGETNRRIPIEWYVRIVVRLRELLGRETGVSVFSDGSDDELAPLLRLERCGRVMAGNALSDMLALARCDVLVPSASTFSQWASFLGRMPVVWFPGQRGSGLYGEDLALEIENDGASSLPLAFAIAVRSRSRAT